ncbi:MAG: lysophospholipid acyltransferase family protein [Verrucomicrobia bacterium]|nr:lysophospholipid acyltransferase family protein [Verrucomicrobiota bacterium]
MSRAFPQLEMDRVYGFFHYLSDVFHDICFRGDVVGVEHLPATGGHLIAANHASHLDPFILGSQMPRQVTFFARKTLWKPGFASWWLDRVGVIPVDRDGGSDVGAIKRVLAALKQEKIIIMFPEGTRSPDGHLQKPKAGVGLFACRTQVAVVPARIFGSFEAFDRRGRIRLGVPVTVVFGKPLPASAYDDPAAGKERYQVASDRIMAEIAKLRPPPETVI